MPRHLIGEFMKRERRDETDNPLRKALCSLCETMVNVERGIRKLIKPPCKTDNLTGSLHTAHRGRSYARRPKLGHVWLEPGMGPSSASDRTRVGPAENGSNAKKAALHAPVGGAEGCLPIRLASI